ncbi:MAG: threonine synthase [Candidatus Acetothermia bacterium]
MNRPVVRCRSCGREFSASTPITYCDNCGSPLSLVFDASGRDLTPKDVIASGQRSMWRYGKLLYPETPGVSLGEGWTPLVRSHDYFQEQDFELYFKLESLNPTFSFKDRGAAVVVSAAKLWGVERIADDSSGNAGAALAAYSAKAGLECSIYVPASASGEKIVQIRSYGARLKGVQGPRENAKERVKRDTKGNDVYYGSHNLSPYFQAGMKTVAFELAEQFDWEVPDHVVVPVGGGALITGIYRGFRELAELGWIERVPRLHPIQSRSCSPIVNALQDDRSVPDKVTPGPTVAEGIHIAIPERSREILKVVRITSGTGVAVPESEIVEHHSKLSRKEGIFPEPTSAVSLAGVARLRDAGEINRGERVVVPITGSGLKDISVAKSHLQ